MAVTFLAVAVFGITTTIISRSKPLTPADPVYKVIPVDNTIHPALLHHEVAKPQKAAPAKSAPKTTPVAIQRFIVMKPAEDNTAQDPKPLNPSMPVGQVDEKGTITDAGNVPPTGLTDGTGDGTGTGKPADDDIHLAGDLQVMPEPVGGANAWAKFLQKNLRYPKIAQEEGAQGRVFMSFVIEKDGHLSNITVERKAGFGFDEEAIRVLKLAPAWKPGIQNGNPVRVRYTIPLNFQMTD